MERRYSSRIQSNVKVILFHCGIPIMVGCIRNMSPGGLFVECATGQLNFNQRVDIELMIDACSGSGINRIHCALSREEDDGVALVVVDEDLFDYYEHFDKVSSHLKLLGPTGISISESAFQFA